MTSPTTSRTILGTDYILEALAAEGLGHLFMVPGGLVDPFLPALARQKKLKPVIAAHEGGAVYMADGYARASGRFGAALGIGGPGCCNMATAVAAAKTDGSPVLVMIGEVAVDLEDRGTFQDALNLMHERAANIAPALTAGETRRREWLAAITAKPRLYDTENLNRTALPIHSAAAIAALRKTFPRSGIVLVDSGAHRAFAGHYRSAYEPR